MILPRSREHADQHGAKWKDIHQRHLDACADCCRAALSASRNAPSSSQASVTACAFVALLLDDSRDVELCAAPAKFSGAHHKPGRFLQWHKLQAAWSLMAAFEQAHDAQFSLVVKLRPDAVPVAGLPSAPWRICAKRDGLEAPVLHAASDFAFWGGRRAMAAAVSVYPGALSAPT